MTKGVDPAVALFLWRFAHSAQDPAHEREAWPLRNPIRYVREGQRFAETIGDLLAAVESPG